MVCKEGSTHEDLNTQFKYLEQKCKESQECHQPSNSRSLGEPASDSKFSPNVS